eukprot:SAG11_NODE_5067_length_1674_cov_1.828571_1_plen_98_part_10
MGWHHGGGSSTSLQEAKNNYNNGADGGYCVPLTSSADKPYKKKKSLRISVWNSFGLSGECMEFLCGSEDEKKAGMFQMRNGGDWILGLTECHGWEQRL